MNKMQMAHEMALAMAANGDVPNENIVAIVWEYTDAMQAEAEKREDKTRPKALLTKDKDGKCLHFNHEFGHKKCMDCGASLEEWQPDWSQAPEWANWWLVDNNGDPQWYSKKPNIVNNSWFVGDPSRGRGAIYRAKEAPSFGYQGNWQNSLWKRPQ